MHAQLHKRLPVHMHLPHDCTTLQATAESTQPYRLHRPKMAKLLAPLGQDARGAGRGFFRRLSVKNVDVPRPRVPRVERLQSA
jgi:hypothetical protein